jgi:peroxiredoxin
MNTERNMNTARVSLSLICLLLAALSGCQKTVTTPSGALTFSGTVTQNGQKAAGITVYLSWEASQAAVTDANGGFAFENLSGSQFILTPSLFGSGFSPSNYELGTTSRTDLAFQVASPSYGSVSGRQAADFTLRNQAGAPVSLSQFHGSVILLDFSADWCGPCRAEAARLEALFDEYKDRGLVIITIMIDGGSAADWATQYGLTFPVLEDTGNGLWNIYGEGYVPLNIVLDRNLTIRYKDGDAGFQETVIKTEIEKYL